MPVIVRREKCQGCEECLPSCPYEAIVIKDGKAFINEYCQSCMVCISTCPEGAIMEIEEKKYDGLQRCLDICRTEGREGFSCSL